MFHAVVTGRRWRLSAFLLGAIAGIVGCSKGPTVYPVSGKILIDGVPFGDSTVFIRFIPNKQKNNDSPWTPQGVAQDDGSYQLYYEPGKAGCAPGWYKVELGIWEKIPGNPRHGPPPRSYINKKYNVADTSGLEIEVVPHPQPNAYDLLIREAADLKDRPRSERAGRSVPARR